MQVVQSIADLRAARAHWPGLAFVPTMGNLHDGHLALVRQAKATGRPVAVSIFVNRLQFAPSEDFERYPRTLEDDLALLAAENVALVFTPTEAEIYPEPQTWRVQPPPVLADILEGAFRPGFFTGVATVVLKLFNLVQPELAVFGKKDYQQLLLVTQMCRQLALPIEILPGETVRTEDGLALSSRNRFLSPTERAQAPELQRCLVQLAARLREGAGAIEPLERAGADRLTARGWQIDYVAIRRAADLQPFTAADWADGAPGVILAAARLGSTRLIDNLELPPEPRRHASG